MGYISARTYYPGRLAPARKVVPWALTSPHYKRHLDRFTRFSTAHGREMRGLRKILRVS